MRQLLLSLTSLLLLSACAREVRPPPATDLTLAGRTAPARNWADVKICQVPAAEREADLVAAGELIETWLAETQMKLEEWTTAKHKTLEAGQRELPAYLDNLKLLRDGQATCPGEESLRAATAKVAAAELEARTRLDVAAREGDRFREAAEVTEWTQAQDQAEEEARSSWCPTDSLPKTPEVYYAREDGDGLQAWYFCDGTRVIRYPGEDRQVKAPEEETNKRRRRPADRLYLSAAANFPDSEIQRAPNRAGGAQAEE